MTSGYIWECVGSPLELPLEHYSSGCARLIGNTHPCWCYQYGASFRWTRTQLQQLVAVITQCVKELEAAPCITIDGYNRVGSYFHDTTTVLRIPAVIFEGYLSYRWLVSRFYGMVFPVRGSSWGTSLTSQPLSHRRRGSGWLGTYPAECKAVSMQQFPYVGVVST